MTKDELYRLEIMNEKEGGLSIRYHVADELLALAKWAITHAKPALGKVVLEEHTEWCSYQKECDCYVGLADKALSTFPSDKAGG